MFRVFQTERERILMCDGYITLYLDNLEGEKVSNEAINRESKGEEINCIYRDITSKYCYF